MAFAWVAMLLIMSCAPAARHAAPQASVNLAALPDEFRAEVMEQRRLWRQQGLNNYRVRFEFIEDTARPVVTRHEGIVDKNTPRGARCAVGTCPTAIFRRIISVTDLFTFMQGIPETCVNQVRYDPALHYPSFISAECAEGVARPFAIRITSLQASN